MLRLSTGLRNKMLKVGGTSAADAMAKGYIAVYTGTQPATADAAETGTLLLRVTKGSAAYTDLVTNGIALKAVLAALNKADGETWSGVGLAEGTAGWYRHYDTAGVLGASTTAVRIDGAVAQSGGQLNIPITAITVGGTTTIDSLVYNFPTA